MKGLQIGILVDCTTKQQYLNSMVVQAEHKVVVAKVLHTLVALPDPNSAVDLWIIDLADVDQTSPDAEAITDALYDFIEASSVPVLVNDSGSLKAGSPAEQLEWTRRVQKRLERLGGDINRQNKAPANEVWVLGASTGGPAAVKDFVAALPPDLGVGFVYVQHIDGGQAEPLAKMISNAGVYPVNVATQGDLIEANRITLITSASAVVIHENSTLLVSGKPWIGGYAPSIDQVVTNVARVYRQRAGVIIFSGMGNDGAAGCRHMRQQGGQVWAQDPKQCGIASMPTEAIATGTVSFTGSPVDLALAFARTRNSPTHNSTAHKKTFRQRG